jgi:peptidoglycan LD-endopeptidase CwlK
MRNIESLSPKMKEKVLQFTAILKAMDIQFFIHDTFRTTAEQEALFAQGRFDIDFVNRLRYKAGMPLIPESENRRIVTKCDGVKKKSRHQSGNAIDIVPMEKGRPVWPNPSDKRWLAMGEVGESLGLEWGGRWTDPDCPHYELNL